MGVIEVIRKQDIEKGLEKKSTEVVKNLILKKLGLTDEEIADVAGVTVDFVQNIRKDLDK